MTDSKYVRAQEEGDVLVIVPLFTFGRFAESDLWEQWRILQKQMEKPELTNVLFDLGEIPYFGSTVLDWMVHMWKQAKAKGGALAVCNCSEIGKEVLTAARFNTLWGIYDTREVALAALANPQDIASPAQSKSIPVTPASAASMRHSAAKIPGNADIV